MSGSPSSPSGLFSPGSHGNEPAAWRLASHWPATAALGCRLWLPRKPPTDGKNKTCLTWRLKKASRSAARRRRTYLDVLLVELGVVLDEALWLHPGALLRVQVEVVVVSSLHPVFHPLTAILTWTESVREVSKMEAQLGPVTLKKHQVEPFIARNMIFNQNIGRFYVFLFLRKQIIDCLKSYKN